MRSIRKKKVFVSGCFDMLHSGHVAFLQEASQYGDLYVGLGSDKTIRELKGRETINSEEERVFMLKSLACIHKVIVNRGSGFMDFSDEMKILCPELVIAIGSPELLRPYISRSAEFGWYPCSFFASGELAGTIAVTESVEAGSISSTMFLINSFSSRLRTTDSSALFAR